MILGWSLLAVRESAAPGHWPCVSGTRAQVPLLRPADPGLLCAPAGAVGGPATFVLQIGGALLDTPGSTLTPQETHLMESVDRTLRGAGWPPLRPEPLCSHRMAPDPGAAVLALGSLNAGDVTFTNIYAPTVGESLFLTGWTPCAAHTHLVSPVDPADCRRLCHPGSHVYPERSGFQEPEAHLDRFYPGGQNALETLPVWALQGSRASRASEALSSYASRDAGTTHSSILDQSRRGPGVGGHKGGNLGLLYFQ
ncbi:hypothetical protein NDU88_000169 [Pleurodeles waltl]|uniref:Uncharacterized protein n=1 Tax=Pleurodeles waltl TaxID=8319 RepID=A0AAV7MR40_PLEWA|nr:hypothetical protein NDU88_000169 [Pleurodeles waltl]